MDEEPVGGRARLADVAHLGQHRAVDGGGDVGVLEDEEGGVAAELHRHPQQLLGRLLDELPAHGGGTREGQLAQARVADDRLADGTRVRGRHDVEDAVGQARLLENAGEQEHRQGRLVGGLDDHGAAGRDGRPDLAGAHREREVPRRDHQGRADRLLHRQQPRRAVRGDRVATGDAHGLLGEPAEELGAVGDLAPGLGDGLAHLQAHQGGELVGPVDERLEGPPEDLAALARRGRRPAGLRLAGGGERGQAVVRGAVGAASSGCRRCSGRATSKRSPPLASRHCPPMSRPLGTASRRDFSETVMGPSSRNGEAQRSSRPHGEP